MLNRATIQGRIPFDMEYKAGDDNKRSFLTFTVSYNTGIKDESTGYYKEDLFRIKAWGPKADFINQYFSKGDQIIVETKLVQGNDYTDKDGNLVKGSIELHAQDAHFCGPKNANSEAKDTAAAPKAGGAKPALNKAGAKPAGNKPALSLGAKGGAPKLTKK